MIGNLKGGIITIEVKSLQLEKILTSLWSEEIRVSKVVKSDVVTATMEVDYSNYGQFIKIVKKHKGKYKVIGKKGLNFYWMKIKQNISLVVGAVIFVVVIFTLSQFIWGIEIETKGIVSPYEIRMKLAEVGIKPGKPKKDIRVKEIEKLLEDNNSNILWLRTRIEGATLKIVVEEKVNPPEVKGELPMGNLTATMEGEVQRVYEFSGRSKVKTGDYVKVGDVLIEGIDGAEESEYNVPPVGVVIANTFYEKSMEVQISGIKEVRTGTIDKDIYMTILGRKIYLKKATKDFVKYDKIEENGSLFSTVKYYEKSDKEIKVDKETSIEEAVKGLEDSLKKNLTKEAVVVDKIITTNEKDSNNLIVNVVFVVQQNIVSSEPVEY